jgi:hypothetical protein
MFNPMEPLLTRPSARCVADLGYWISTSRPWLWCWSCQVYPPQQLQAPFVAKAGTTEPRNSDTIVRGKHFFQRDNDS